MNKLLIEDLTKLRCELEEKLHPIDHLLDCRARNLIDIAIYELNKPPAKLRRWTEEDCEPPYYCPPCGTYLVDLDKPDQFVRIIEDEDMEGEFLLVVGGKILDGHIEDSTWDIESLWNMFDQLYGPIETEKENNGQNE
jgi:hypothetical protein